MIILSATCIDGEIRLRESLPAELEGKEIQIFVQTASTPKISSKRRKAGSAKGLIQIDPDFDAPLPDFQEYME